MENVSIVKTLRDYIYMDSIITLRNFSFFFFIFLLFKE